MSWPTKDMFAVTADGAVLINVLAIDEDNPPPLALQKGVFVGIVLTEGETKLASERVYDALSELAVTISGRRRPGVGRPVVFLGGLPSRDGSPGVVLLGRLPAREGSPGGGCLPGLLGGRPGTVAPMLAFAPGSATAPSRACAAPRTADLG